jgi:hypothetical protein
MSEITFTLFLDTLVEEFGRIDNLDTHTVEGQDVLVPWIKEYIGQNLLLDMSEVRIRTRQGNTLNTLMDDSTELFRDRFNDASPFEITVSVLALLPADQVPAPCRRFLFYTHLRSQEASQTRLRGLPQISRHSNVPARVQERFI